jgi:hypothetical protein
VLQKHNTVPLVLGTSGDALGAMRQPYGSDPFAVWLLGNRELQSVNYPRDFSGDLKGAINS